MATAALTPAVRATGETSSLALVARPGTLGLGAHSAAVFELVAPARSAGLRFPRGAQLQVSFQNDLPLPVALHWRGLEGATGLEPLLGRPPVPPGGKETVVLPLAQAGTLMVAPTLLTDDGSPPVRPLPLVVEEREAPATDRDIVLLIEEWRVSPDGKAMAPGRSDGGSTAAFTVNGQVEPEIKLRLNERVRLRFINGSQRSVVALKIEGRELMVMAIDGRPAEPFAARNGAVILPPRGRCDAFVDAALAAGTSAALLLHDGKQAHPVARLLGSAEPPFRADRLPAGPPLPADKASGELPFSGALRIDLPLGAGAAWVGPAQLSSALPPAFRARAGQTVVLALANAGGGATTFHLHGHHFRLLDRLDDGWKPFWLDTLAVEPGQTQRIAFRAQRGSWLLETAGNAWEAPQRLRWFAVA